MTLGEVIRQRRIELGLTQQRLAEMTGLRRPSISRIEADSYVPSLGALDVLATHLQCRTADLLLAREARGDAK